MTTRINVVDSTEAKNYIHELFGSLKPEDCAVVKLEDMALMTQLHDANEDSSTLNTSVTLANIKEFRKNAEIILNRNITNEDVAVVNLNQEKINQTNISISDISGLKNRLSTLGIDFDLSNVAIVTADDIQRGLSQENNNKTTRKLK